MQRPPVVAVRNIAPNNAQITNAQFIKPNQQQQLLRAQNAAFPLTLNPNSAINPQFMVAKNDQGQMFLVPPTGQNSLVQLQTQTLQPQNALQSPAQRSVGQIIKVRRIVSLLYSCDRSCSRLVSDEAMLRRAKSNFR